MTLTLSGRVALVTGARAGIGAGIAAGLAKAGADVALTAREPEALDATESTVQAAGVRALRVGIELRDPASVEAGVARVIAELGRIDILVNNAGATARLEALDYGQEDWDAILETNLRGAFLMAQAAARDMIPRHYGRIINISSTYARAVQPRRAAYAASKAGLEQLTRVLALEWAPHGVTVNAVAPTSTRTPGRQDKFADPGYEAKRAADIPLGRLGTPEDVAQAAVFLASEGAGFITGHTLAVDGGYTLR
ncbi:MAG TPA: glucose 1-dehydrogenase [Candidatus Dormibacteraeota bacterium]